jgi:hypothetical protein
MILERTDWNGDDDGKGDSVGRNAFAYICWPDQTYLKNSILDCIRVRDDSYLQFYRYPGFGADTISRDHIGAIIVAFYVNRDWKELDWILDNLPWRLSRKYTQTLDFWLWQTALKYRRNWKRYLFEYLFLFLVMSMFLFVIPWNFLVRLVLGIKRVNLYDNPKFVKFEEKSWKWYLNRTLYPHYALFLLAWQIKILSKSWFKKIVQFLLRFESRNIVIDAILGKEISNAKWKHFRPVTSFIWSRRIDNVDDVVMRPMMDTESKFNDLNRGLLDYLYYRIDRIMLEFDDTIVESIKSGNKIIQY